MCLHHRRMVSGLRERTLPGALNYWYFKEQTLSYSRHQWNELGFPGSFQSGNRCLHESNPLTQDPTKRELITWEQLNWWGKFSYGSLFWILLVPLSLFYFYEYMKIFSFFVYLTFNLVDHTFVYWIKHLSIVSGFNWPWEFRNKCFYGALLTVHGNAVICIDPIRIYHDIREQVVQQRMPTESYLTILLTS